MSEHGFHHPARRMARLCLQYPWSVLWVLSMALVASIAGGAVVMVIIILGGQGVILLHSLHLDKVRRRRRR